MSLLSRLFSTKPDPREELRPLWHALVAEARDPTWYTDGGVADTVPGRFDMVCAVFATTQVRMERDGALADESVLLTELFVEDMDGQLREFGVGDVVVGKHVTKLMGAMGGRLKAYRDGLTGGETLLSEALVRNVSFGDRGDAGAVARRMLALAARLDRTDDAALVAGRIAA